MKFFKSCLLAVLLPLLPGAMKAEQVDWAALGNMIIQNNGSTLTNNAPGSTLLLGHFTTGFTFSPGQSYQTLIANFTTYDTSFIGEGIPGAGAATSGQFFASTFPPSTLPGTVGDSLYMWFFNSSSPANATQMAIITNPTWIRPPSGGGPGTSTTIDASDLGTFVPPNAPGSIGISPDPVNLVGNIRLSPVPEPSTYVLALVGLGVAGGVARRRRATAC